ncbi:MAG: hypothetical protein HY822_22710 [Acidobacteria bacterium]|nr:hypothetical protein [Acidobacteriota bacterium]
MRLKPVVALALAGALVLPAPILAQAAGAAAQKLVAQSGNLKIVVLEGEGAKNNVRAKSATAPVVEVRDEADKPVTGAEVVFQLPATGPGGVFHGWMRTQTVRSDAEGKAGTSGYTPNDEEGRFNIKVTATAGAKTGGAVIAQSNVRGTGASAGAAKKTWWKPVAVIAAVAVVGGVVAGTRGDNKTAATVTVPVTITPGAVSVGGPR